ncbi:hypothetical protein ACGYLO_18565 [Sulfitobacter sp. 1A13353]|uniref:hypothetical protein n=1 Tax=Sulfitobacter sp. 1A13353 TaxID=3368568 RepID=UPI003745CABD
MLPLVPVMFIATIAMTIFYTMSLSYDELQVDPSIANDFLMVHEYRIDVAGRDSVTDGPITDMPGYPFESFYSYYTEVHETDRFIAIATWPDGENASISLPDVTSHSILAQYDGQLQQGMYAGTFRPDDTGSGGTLAGFELNGLDREPDSETAVLLKVFIKD